MGFSLTTDMFNYSFKPGLAEKLELFNNYGFQYIHWCDNWADEVLYSKQDMKEYAQVIQGNGLECLDVHGTATSHYRIDSLTPEGKKGYIKLLENRVRFCHTVGGDSVVVHPPSVHQPNMEKRVHESKRTLDTVKPLCLDLGVALAMENCYKGDQMLLSDYFKLYDPIFLGWCYDSGHANNHGNLRHLKPFSDRLIVTHLHDNNETNDDHQYPGWGTINWEDVSLWLSQLSLDKPLNLEVTHNPLFFRGTMEEFMDKVVESTSLL